jgi:hypothetical protein
VADHRDAFYNKAQEGFAMFALNQGEVPARAPLRREAGMALRRVDVTDGAADMLRQPAGTSVPESGPGFRVSTPGQVRSVIRSPGDAEIPGAIPHRFQSRDGCPP